MLRMDETEEEVDFRPRRPADERRYEECGVRGTGERDDRLWEAIRVRGLYKGRDCGLRMTVEVEP